MVGLYFSAGFDNVYHEALFLLNHLSEGGPFLGILTEFLTDNYRGLLLVNTIVSEDVL